MKLNNNQRFNNQKTKFESKIEIKKQDSFYGNRSIVMSKKLLRKIKSNALINKLFITDIGYYPHALHHYRQRGKGISENILIYCINGSGMIELDRQSYPVTANTFFVIPALEPHTYWASENNPWSIYWLHFSGEKCQCFESLFCKIIPLDSSVNNRLNDRINLFNEILTALELGFSKENIEFANLLLNSLLASFFYVETYRVSKGHQSNNPVDKSIFYMQKNLNQCLKIQDIANHVQLSESHLSKVFKNKTGSSPIEYFINLKMQEAIRLIANQSLRIKEVAFTLGYDDPFYFSRLFKKHIGSSPIEFLVTSKTRNKNQPVINPELSL